MKSIILLLFTVTFIMSSCASDDPVKVTPTVQLSDKEIMEGDAGGVTLNFSVKLQEAVDTDVLVSYDTDDGSAFQNLDYVKKSGSLTIPAGSVEATLSIEIKSDQIKEGNEVFRLKFDVDPGVTMQKSTATITIINDDSDLPYTTEDYTTPAAYEGWTKTWADEFEAASINSTWWTHEIGGGGWGNNELEYYTASPENSRVDDGSLIIEARNDTWDGQHQYTSARMITKGKKSFGSSRTDIRARLPYGQGIWPALWMLGNSIDTKSWPACGEIDIMELIGKQPATSHATVHWGSDFANHKYIGNSYILGDGYLS
ncbi:MAG: family 16 glycosylhydrolase [Cyclobacteriaceae bacterium]|nr:family 16 glycosylhydrolase [Cyclobacteriaceae bacterium]